MSVRTALAATLLVFLSTACNQGSTPIDPEPTKDPGRGQLSGCHGKASATIPSDGIYDLTTFGGPGDSQPVACGGSTQSGSWWYAASSQRFGCGARLRIEANGKCVVAQVADYGPDVCVESAAGRPIIDASPLVGRALFGSSELGWSDRAKIHVAQVAKTTPLGACETSGGTSSSSASSSSSSASIGSSNASTGSSGGNGGSGGASGGGGETTSASTGGGMACASDGDCNPGNDGSGMICTSHLCVPGCHHDYQCPGVTSCVNGFCE